MPSSTRKEQGLCSKCRVPHQATFALSTSSRRCSLAACVLRQMMYRWIMLPCWLWLTWSVPSSAKSPGRGTWPRCGSARSGWSACRRARRGWPQPSHRPGCPSSWSGTGGNCRARSRSVSRAGRGTPSSRSSTRRPSWLRSSTTPSATRKLASFARLQVENGRPCSAGLDLAIFLISRRFGRVKVFARRSCGSRPDPVRAGERYFGDLRHGH